MAEEIGVPSLTLPTRAGSREGGLPSRRSLYLVPTRGWGVVVDTAEHSHRMLKGFQIASASVSLVRIRTTWSRPYTKILPSPIFPVFADEVIVLMILST
jgi:hypothetical protein